MKKITINDLIKWKQNNCKFPTSTAYDASFAQIFEHQNMPVLLVGDSLGMVLQGHPDTLSVTLNDIVYHTRSVRAGSPNCLLMADMPFMTITSSEKTCENAAQLIRAGANMVKIEGGRWLVDTIKMLTERAVPVCGHLGLTPQSVNIFGGYKIQGKETTQAEEILNDALALQDAGAQVLVLECVPSTLAKKITETLDIPVIGIGAGPDTDGQILVMHDMLGISANYMPKFSKNFLTETGDIKRAVTQYMDDVKSGLFPDEKHTIA